MSTKLLLLLFSLAMLLGACQKEKVEPEPDLYTSVLGRWLPESTTEYHYNASGALVNTKVVPYTIQDYYMEITKDSLRYRLVNGDTLLAGGGTFTRQGNTFISPPYNGIIKELTDRKLVMLFKDSRALPNTARVDIEDTFSRL